MAKRDHIAEIVERRSRLPKVRAMFSLLDRLRSLEEAFENRDRLTDEMMRYFPVAVIACLEGFFRELIRELIDHGPPFSERIERLEVEKIDINVLKAIHGRTVTVGEFLAHQVSLSTFERVCAVMNALLGEDLVLRLKTTRSPISVRVFGENAPSVLGDSDSVVRGVVRAFELRHILAHELATSFPITRTEIEEAFTSATTFIYGAEELVSQLVEPEQPITQSEMTQLAARRFKEADNEFERTEALIRGHLPENRVAEFERAQKAWRIAREETSQLYRHLIANGGTLGNQVYYGMMREITENRTSELRIVAGSALGLPLDLYPDPATKTHNPTHKT